MVNAAYGDQALFRSNIFRRYGRFCDAREDSEDDPCIVLQRCNGKAPKQNSTR
jgi:hypothetical protein